MITGFNTDIEHRSVTFHVQTEERGIDNPIIETIVYVKGQIIVAKKTSYEDLIVDGTVDENELRERMVKQHKLVAASIKAGKLDGKIDQMIKEGLLYLPSWGYDMPILDKIKSDADNITFDSIVVQFIEEKTKNNRLSLVLDKAEPELKLGEKVTLYLRAIEEGTGNPVEGAVINAKFLSTIDGALAWELGTTDSDGSLVVEIDFPPLEQGRALFVIKAESSCGFSSLTFNFEADE